MSDDNLVLARLREIRDLLGAVKEDTAELKLRVGMIEAGYASLSLRIDRLSGDPADRSRLYGEMSRLPPST